MKSLVVRTAIISGPDTIALLITARLVFAVSLADDRPGLIVWAVFAARWGALAVVWTRLGGTVCGLYRPRDELFRFAFRRYW